MARKKRNKTRFSFKRGAFKKKKKSGAGWFGPSLLKILKISTIAGFVVGIGILLYYADKKFIKPAQSGKTGRLILKDVPLWTGEHLKEKIVAVAGGRTMELNENTAKKMAENLKSVAWIYDTTVQTTDDSILVYAQYRRPVAVIKSGQIEFYVDAQQVVLDYVPMPNLLLVEIKIEQLQTQDLRYGQKWQRDDLAAALKILDKINQRDIDLVNSEKMKPLISEISSIDVRNYQGRRNRSRPHIVLYSTDNTEIQWGAEIGAWQKYLESTDEQKLAKLYGYYEQEGTLNGGTQIKFINLRDPQDKIPLPIDRY